MALKSKSPKRKRSVAFQLRLTKEENDRLALFAERNGLGKSTFLRLLLRAADGRLPRGEDS